MRLSSGEGVDRTSVSFLQCPPHILATTPPRTGQRHKTARTEPQFPEARTHFSRVNRNPPRAAAINRRHPAIRIPSTGLRGRVHSTLLPHFSSSLRHAVPK